MASVTCRPEGAAAVAREVTAAGGQAVGLAMRRPPRGVRCRASSTAPWTSSAASTAVDHNAAWSHPRLDTDAVGVDLGVWDRVIETITRGALLLARHAIPHDGGTWRRLHRHDLVGHEHDRRVDPGRLWRVQGRPEPADAPSGRPLRPRRHPGQRHRSGLHPHRDGDGPGALPTCRGVWPRRNPTRRLGTPDDIARVVVFLCSDAAAYVNGQLLHVDGGHQIAGMM